LDPDFHPASGALAYALLVQGRLDESIETSNAVLKKHPNYARGYLRLAQAYKAKGSIELAEQNLTRAKQLDQEDLVIQKGI
ncbi:tetratricopeptide repeat protein, partial [Acinetobacter baumannii]